MPCDYLAEGCSWDDDCKPGLGCGWVDGRPVCLDIDECKQDPDVCASTPGTECLNLISTYRCVDPEENRVALVIGGTTGDVSAGLKSIEVYSTYQDKGGYLR